MPWSKRQPNSRRRFLKLMAACSGSAALGFSPLRMLQAQASTPAALPEDKKLGIALVGLGSYSSGQLAPALQETSYCKLSGVVTGSPEKIPVWQRKYGIPEKNVYNYDNFDSIAENPDIDIIYVVLPNGMHKEYTIRAAEASKHVICEKPMATSAADCQAMIDACKQACKKLSIGYRLHFEPHNQEMMHLGQKQVFGDVRKISTADSFRIGQSDSWRLDKALSGGGPLMDIGIYCVQGAIYTKGQVPVSVTAEYLPVTQPEKFREVEQGIRWQMQFKDGSVANCSSSYAENENYLRAEAEKGWFALQPAFSYSGIRGETSKGPMDVRNVNQQARQMDAFAQCIMEDRNSRVPGEMGKRDVAILYAIYEAADTGKKVMLSEEVRNALVDHPH